MISFSESQISELLDYKSLIPVLEKAFAGAYTVPQRHHHNFKNPVSTIDSTLLLMPAWDNEKYLGVKLVTVSPENKSHALPTIQGMYLLFDIKTGVPLMRCDARALTNLRTAAASALASKYLSRKDSKTLLMIGTGALAPQLIKAHCTIRDIRKVMIWGRNFKKAVQIADSLSKESISCEAVQNLENSVHQADIISCATLSESPVIKGEWLQAGQHIDLVGSYQPHMREADDEVIKKSMIFVDTMQGAPKESGDLAIPIQSGVLKLEDIKADLFKMCESNSECFRNRESDITLFKSVGHALEDLAAASFAFEKIKV